MHTPKVLVLAEFEDLALQVERVVASLRPHPVVVWCGRLDTAEDVMTEAGPFDILVAGPIAGNDAGFTHLRRLRALSPQTQLVLALKHWRSSDLRQTVRAGALDVLRLPVSDTDLLEAMEQALETVFALAAGPAPLRGSSGRADRQGVVIAVVSASGGSGKTFLATNLAFHLQSESKRETALIDLDLQFGELSTALRLRPRHTIHDVLSPDGGGDLASRLEEHLERHESGIRVLAAPEDPAQADNIDAFDVGRVLDTLRARFDYVVVDTPTALSEPVLVAIEQADQIFVLATLDLPSVRNLGIMLTTLKKLKVPTERISLLLNKVEPDVGIEVSRVEQYFPQGFAMVIPYGREVNRSLNMGQPVLAYAPRGEVSKALMAGLARTITGNDEDDEEAAIALHPNRRSWRRRKSA